MPKLCVFHNLGNWISRLDINSRTNWQILVIGDNLVIRKNGRHANLKLTFVKIFSFGEISFNKSLIVSWKVFIP